MRVDAYLPEPTLHIVAEPAAEGRRPGYAAVAGVALGLAVVGLAAALGLAATHGPLANLFADSAVGLWLNHNDAMAAQTYAIAAALRGSDEPEKLPWVTRIIGLQIASTIAYQQQQQMRRPAS